MAPNAAPYLTASWVQSFVDEFAGVMPMQQLWVRDTGNELLGTCLLCRRTDRRAGLPLRRVYLNTSGESAADSVVVEHNAVLCSPAHEAAVYSAVARTIEAAPVDEFLLAGATEAAVALFQHALPNWDADCEWRESPYVDLEALRASGRDHLAVLSRNTREQLRRSMRRYQERGALVIESAGTLVEARSMFTEMVALHEQHWHALGQCGGFATPSRRAFHRCFLERAFPMGEAQLLRVRAGDHVVGILYNLIANGHVCFYQSGLRYDDDKQLKPGLVVHHLAIGHCLAAGFRQYDFLPSAPSEGRYKTSLATDAHRIGTVVFRRPGWRHRYFGAVRAVRRFVARRFPNQPPTRV